MIELEENAGEYLKKILAGLPSDHARIVKERFDSMAETLLMGYIEESQRIEKMNLSQCKGLMASLTEQMPPNIKDEILETIEER
jgi:hypothetical protein